MSTYTVACPQCHASLRSAKPVPSNQMLRCPQCGGSFTADEPDELPSPAPAAPSTTKTGLIAFGLAGLFVAGGAGLALLILHETPRDTVGDAQRRASQERLNALQKQVDELREEKDRDRRRQMEQASHDLEMKAKTKEETHVALPAAAEVSVPLQPKVVIDDAEQKKRADYESHMDAGRAAMVASRYADAVREYLAAQRLIPDDAKAIRGQRDAEDRLAAQQDQDKLRSSFDRLLEKAKTALNAKRYDEAVNAASEALRLFPKDAEAKQVLLNATKARRIAKASFDQLMSQANALMSSGQYQNASLLYSQALQLFPDDDTAQRGVQATAQMTQNVQVGQSAYIRTMAAGTLAMQSLQYGTAARAFTAALQLAPGDLAAASGLQDAQAAMAGTAVGLAAYYQQLQLGYAALQAQRPADAITAFKAALQLVPNSPLAIAGLRQARGR